MNPIRVTVWNEYRHERTEEAVARVYPEGIHNCIAAFLREAGFARVEKVWKQENTTLLMARKNLGKTEILS